MANNELTQGHMFLLSWVSLVSHFVSTLDTSKSMVSLVIQRREAVASHTN